MEGPLGRASPSPRFPQSPAVPGCRLLSLPFPAFPEGASKTPGSTYRKTRACLADQECLSGQIKLRFFLLSHLGVFLRKEKKKREQRPEGHCLEIPTQNLNHRSTKTLYFLMQTQVESNPVGLSKVRLRGNLFRVLNSSGAFLEPRTMTNSFSSPPVSRLPCSLSYGDKF